jgi:hypothetical protein
VHRDPWLRLPLGALCGPGPALAHLGCGRQHVASKHLLKLIQCSRHSHAADFGAVVEHHRALGITAGHRQAAIHTRHVCHVDAPHTFCGEDNHVSILGRARSAANVRCRAGCTRCRNNLKDLGKTKRERGAIQTTRYYLRSRNVLIGGHNLPVGKPPRTFQGRSEPTRPRGRNKLVHAGFR